MKRQLRIWVAFGALVALPACAGAGLFGRGDTDGSGSAVQGYNFAYRVDDRGLGLVQVFDDGRNTYFQLRVLDLEHVPVLWSEDSAGRRRAVPLRASGPYLIAGELDRKFVLTLGAGKATAVMTDWAKRAVASREDPGKPVVKPASAALVPVSAPVAAPPMPTDGAPSVASSTGCAEPMQSPALRTVDVPFAREATEPTIQARKDLRAIAMRLAAAGSIVIRGRPSPGGGVVQARSRAAGIKTLLLEAGVPAWHMRIEISGTPEAGQVEGLFLSQIEYGAPSSGFVVLDGC